MDFKTSLDDSASRDPYAVGTKKVFSVEEIPCKLSVYDYRPRVGTNQHRSVYYD